MSKILAVFGATGQQGSSVISHVLADPELSLQYRIRAITRDVQGEKAKQLLKGNVEVVHGDVVNRSSLETTLTGAHTVFAMTAPDFGPDALETEYANGKAIADVAVAKGVQYLIFSTLPPIRDISGGKYTKVTAFDAKAKIEQYIRTLPIKSAFYCPGSFMENFQFHGFLTPRAAPDGSWVMTAHASPQCQLPLLAAVGDGGKFVGAILADPDRYDGKTLHAATALYSLEEVCAIMAEVTGKKVVYKQISPKDYRRMLPSVGTLGDVFFEGLSYYDDFGYFGPGTKELVAEAAEQARGKLSTLQEYFQAHAFQLE